MAVMSGTLQNHTPWLDHRGTQSKRRQHRSGVAACIRNPWL